MDVFFSADDRQEYLDLLSQSASKHALDFLAGCLMSNHAHFVVVPVGRDRSRARSEKRIADTRGWSIAVKVGGVLCGRSASILIRWTNGGPVKRYGLSFLRGPCLSDYRSALCGVCVRLKSKNR